MCQQMAFCIRVKVRTGQQKCKLLNHASRVEIVTTKIETL